MCYIICNKNMLDSGAGGEIVDAKVIINIHAMVLMHVETGH